MVIAVPIRSSVAPIRAQIASVTGSCVYRAIAEISLDRLPQPVDIPDQKRPVEPELMPHRLALCRRDRLIRREVGVDGIARRQLQQARRSETRSRAASGC